MATMSSMFVLTMNQVDALNSEEEDEKDRQRYQPVGHDYREIADEDQWGKLEKLKERRKSEKVKTESRKTKVWTEDKLQTEEDMG